MSVTPTSYMPFDPTLDGHEIVQALQDANATRYLGAVGLVILFYDHLLTLPDEVKLVWGAPASFAKYAFLLNRYLVLASLITVAHAMAGFVPNAYSDAGCVHLFVATSMLSLCSVGIANILVLLRVIILWDHRPIILKLMTAGFLVSFLTQTTMMALSIVKMYPGVSWNVVTGMCVTARTTPRFIGVWASPLLFELLVLLSTLLNALDRPQQSNLPLTKALYRDGISYFFAVTSFRVLNLTLAITARPSMIMLGVFLVWAMTTTILNRSLLRLRRTELKAAEPVSGRASPFGLRVGMEIVRVDSGASDSLQWNKLQRLRSL